MKKSMKTLLSAVLALVMVITATSAFTANVFAEGEPTKAGYYYDYQEITVGENVLTPQASGVTLYSFTATETGKYIFTLDDENAFVGYYGSNEWFPSNNATLSYTLTFNHTEVNQPVLIGVSGTTSVTLTITKEGAAEVGPTIPTVVYENKVTPEEFEFPESLDPNGLDYVNIDDNEEDKAVLGEDGYYHLNNADGPILFAGLNDSMVSLLNMFGYGQLKAAIYEGETAVRVDNFNDAFYEYFVASGGTYDFDSLSVTDAGCGYYPLTEDLITMYKALGASQGWFEEDGVVGGALPDGDAWMFACYYDEDFTTFDVDDNNNNNDNNSNNDTILSPETSDVNILAFYGMFFVAAAGLLIIRKRVK